jgi:hypothetical protein
LRTALAPFEKNVWRGLAMPNRRKESLVDDFPIAMKLVVWLVVGGTVAYAIFAMVYNGMGG